MRLVDPRGIWVKVDGVTRPEDIEAAVDAGVSAVGMILAPSLRRVDASAASRLRDEIPEGVEAFGVFGPDAADVRGVVDALSLTGVQVPSELDVDIEPGVLLLRTVRVRHAADLLACEDLACDAVHLDAYVPGELGGTGQLAPWDLIEAHRPGVPFVISGGLRPDNVAEAVRRLRPAGVDVSSGVESGQPGVKDPTKLCAFVEAARAVR